MQKYNVIIIIKYIKSVNDIFLSVKLLFNLIVCKKKAVIATAFFLEKTNENQSILILTTAFFTFPDTSLGAIFGL